MFGYATLKLWISASNPTFEAVWLTKRSSPDSGDGLNFVGRADAPLAATATHATAAARARAAQRPLTFFSTLSSLDGGATTATAFGGRDDTPILYDRQRTFIFLQTKAAQPKGGRPRSRCALFRQKRLTPAETRPPGERLGVSWAYGSP